jgi:hypothetical protein
MLSITFHDIMAPFAASDGIGITIDTKNTQEI